MRQRFWPFACAAAVLSLSAPLAAQEQEPLAAEAIGIADTPPREGAVVRTEKGFLVPYKLTIPGTTATLEMVPIPGGVVKVGSPEGEEGRSDEEGPQFEVEVEPFWMSKHEVTWAEYKEFMTLYSIFKQFEIKRVRTVSDENRADAITAPTELYDPTFTFEHGEDPRQPAVTMTHYAARQHTKWLSGVTGHFYRLPTEAEWEHAARAGATTAYHFGDDPSELGEYAWYDENSDGTTHPVGQKKPNAWGLYDMHGNVAEWVIDELLEEGYKKFAGKKVSWREAIVWPTKPYPRVAKGGQWEDSADRLRVAARLGSHDEDWKSEDPNLPLSPWWFTSDPARGVGFRVVRPFHEAPRAEKVKFWDYEVEDIAGDVDARLTEGRGVLGLVDPELPIAIQKLKEDK